MMQQHQEAPAPARPLAAEDWRLRDMARLASRPGGDLRGTQ
jgi:hypothetical protein